MTIAADITARALALHAAFVAAGKATQGAADFVNSLQGMRRTMRAATFYAMNTKEDR